jgi:hypothetical protein
MASDLEKIHQAFRILADVAFPDGYLAEMELVAINAHLDATKGVRAAHLLATRGPEEAAALLGCSRTQVYILARQSSKSVRIVDEAA